MLSAKQKQIIIFLGKYKFLTRSQLAKLGVEKYNSNFSKYCNPLVDSKMIGCIDAKMYGLEYIYYLTKKGAIQLSNICDTPLDQINYTKNSVSLKPQNLHHRKYAIDCQIEFIKTCEINNITIDFYDRDIDTHNAKLQRKTRVPLPQNKYIEPDAIFRINSPKGKKMYCLELENNTYPQKSFEKILTHITALNTKAPSKKYKHDKAHRVLMIYTNPTIMETVRKRLVAHVAQLSNWFLFKSFDNVLSPVSLEKSSFIIKEDKDFFGDWINGNNKITSMY